MGLILFIIMLECISYFGFVYILCYLVYSRFTGSYCGDYDKSLLDECIILDSVILFLLLYSIILLGGYL